MNGRLHRSEWHGPHNHPDMCNHPIWLSRSFKVTEKLLVEMCQILKWLQDTVNITQAFHVSVCGKCIQVVQACLTFEDFATRELIWPFMCKPFYSHCSKSHRYILDIWQNCASIYYLHPTSGMGKHQYGFHLSAMLIEAVSAKKMALGIAFLVLQVDLECKHHTYLYICGYGIMPCAMILDNNTTFVWRVSIFILNFG